MYNAFKIRSMRISLRNGEREFINRMKMNISRRLIKKETIIEVSFFYEHEKESHALCIAFHYFAVNG